MIMGVQRVSKHKETHHQEAPESETGAEQPSVEELQQRLETAEAALKEANDKMLRSMADAENIRRRASLDVENAHKFGVEKIARELLNVVDSLESGLEAVTEPDQVQIQHLREGMQLTHKLLLDILSQFQIKQINPLGEVFDPKLHEALTTQPSADADPNTVLVVVQKGYLIHDRVLRPARVVVAKMPEAAAS
jgi:molecular chaperone GrpE